MIPIPNDYQAAAAYGGGNGPQLTPGGHICIIQGARIEKTRNTNRDMLVVAFDIYEDGEFSGYYRRQYERMKQYNVNATWPGVFRVTICNAAGNTNGFFKGFIEAVEQSNEGYNFLQSRGDERLLKGKRVGFNFGEEEYERQNRQTGVYEVAVSVKPQYAVSCTRVIEGVIPPERKTLQSYSQAVQQGAQAPAPAPAEGFTELADDEPLPF